MRWSKFWSAHCEAEEHQPRVASVLLEDNAPSRRPISGDYPLIGRWGQLALRSQSACFRKPISGGSPLSTHAREGCPRGASAKRPRRRVQLRRSFCESHAGTARGNSAREQRAGCEVRCGSASAPLQASGFEDRPRATIPSRAGLRCMAYRRVRSQAARDRAARTDPALGRVE